MRKVLLSAMLVCGLASCETTPAQPDPTQIRLEDMDTRLGRVERVVNNQSLVELSQRIDVLEAQLRELRGSAEELQNSSEAVRKQQRDLYSDLDRRLGALEAAMKGSAASVDGRGASSGTPVTSGAAAGVSDQSAYARAFDALKAGDFNAAVTQFREFMSTYPSSGLLDNAQYWLGEAYYVTRDYDSAATAFRNVGERWPQSRKAPDALLKLGFTQYEQKHFAEARATLAQVTQRFPGTDAAKLAQDRLQKMPADAR